MTLEAQRIAIAKACGGQHNHRDYPNDLNAMHEAESILDEVQTGMMNDLLIKSEAPSFGYAFRSTAAQRAEAFLKTLNLWTP